MEIKNSKDGKEGVKLHNINNIDDFKKEWIRQGGKIIEDMKDGMDLVVKNRDGDIRHLFVLGDTIFPFDFGDEK